MDFPRLIIAALRGGSGKTILSVGIIAAWSKFGRSIAPFKKGPDYIDAGWLALAASRPCYNLDSFLLTEEDNLRSFLSHSIDCDISVIEGNRGLYDGIDLQGSTSTAELAKLLKAPVVLCVDCTKITRTMAAVISGCLQFDSEVMIKGVILNQVANARHEKKLRDSIAHYCGLPVLGAIPKLGQQHFPERHLGLVPTPEHDWAKESIGAVKKIAENHIDLNAIETIARDAPPLKEFKSRLPETRSQRPEARDRKAEIKNQTPAPRIGIIKDSAFQFYYPENIDALATEGAEIVFISPLTSQTLPELDGLYIGGGFPETHAEQLAENKSFSQKLRWLVEDGLPIYAECGGLMYLGEELILEGKSYPMAGVLPLVFDFFKRPRGHGYTIVTVEGENPYYPVGTEIRGHEFHYSRVKKWAGDEKDLVFLMKRGVGIFKDRDGILYKNVLATYTHVHALGTPEWARALVRNAINYKKLKK
ncbi:MAG: cobyrinate a,c-diamide synthase [Desulfobacterales bacterium]|nr:MAG: cobyrinate a,c-diamide synthase [Desulfobacterales bacterium]